MFPVNIDSLRHFSRKYIPINAGKSRNVIRDFGIYSAVMAGCTLVGLLFRQQGFSDATIITVYILGVLISAVLVTGRSDLGRAGQQLYQQYLRLVHGHDRVQLLLYGTAVHAPRL